MRHARLAWVPLLTVLALLGPVLAGLVGTLLPAFGWFPAAGARAFSLASFEALFAWPGLPQAMRLSLVTGVVATALSLGIVQAICAGWFGRAPFRVLQRLLSPLLSVPHAAAAFGLAFLIAPSGWIARLLAPTMGWERPLDLLILQDPWGLAMIAGLVVKEVPFLLLMTLAALPQADAPRSLLLGRMLGYGRIKGWLILVLPRVYAQVRLPVYVVLAYSMSVVDVAIILGPNTPPALAVQITRWMGDPDLAFRMQAAAGAVVQLGLVMLGFGIWRLAEGGVARLGRHWAAAGGRARWGEGPGKLAGFALGVVVAGAVLGGLAALSVWSFAALWQFPDLLPDALTLRSWSRHGPDILSALGVSALLALCASLLALVLVIGCLEAEHRHGLRLTRRGTLLLYVPLLVPQIAFLPGLQTLLIFSGASTGFWPVLAGHLVFVLPYVFLSLADPFRAWDRRFATIGAALGRGPDAVLWRVRLPMLLAPVLTAFAVGFAVSVGQFLPTLLVGGGRVATLTTEAVALAAGGDRRAIGVYGLAQTGLALLPFLLAVGLPLLVFRNRKGLRVG